MTAWELQTNERTYLRLTKPTREEMYIYIRRKLSEGYRLSEIIFVYGPKPITKR